MSRCTLLFIKKQQVCGTKFGKNRMFIRRNSHFHCDDDPRIACVGHLQDFLHFNVFCVVKKRSNFVFAFVQ